MTADALLSRLAGPGAAFHEGQREAIAALVEDRRRVLCVQRTGWGKSAVYFIATALLRADGAGPTLLISPLLALMRNQIAAARSLGVRAATMNSANRDDWDDVRRAVAADAVDLLLVSPERLANPAFRADVLGDVLGRVGLLVVDEAHCVSDWGHDFRPDYRRIASLLAALPADAAVLCTTATANDRVVHDVQEQLGSAGGLLTIRGSLDRPALRLEVVDLPAQAERLAWLAEWLPSLPGSGIVYCLTVRDTELVAGWLRSRGLRAAAYSGATDPDRRLEIEDALLRNELDVVVATSALGMGFDKPDLGFVVHFQAPGSVIAYYQQVGRAGRRLERAEAVLLRGYEDRSIQDFFIDVAFPPPERVRAVVELLASAGGPVTLGALLASENVGRPRLEALLKVLEVEGAVRRAGRGGWERTAVPWAYDEERARRVTEVRRAEQAAMRAYADGGRCLMQALREELDDPLAEPCGRCAVCAGPRFAAPPEPALVAEAVAYVRGRPVVLEPRRAWPPGSGRGRLAAEEQVGEGRALAAWGDAGWGRLVREGCEAGAYAEELALAAAALVREWAPEPAPAWVAAIPSAARPGAVEAVAARVADDLSLPYAAAIRRVREGAPQAAMANSAQQMANVVAAFAVAASPPPGPVLLVDELAASRWTLAVVGRLLRRAGVEAVHPVVLATRPAAA